MAKSIAALHRLKVLVGAMAKSIAALHQLKVLVRAMVKSIAALHRLKVLVRAMAKNMALQSFCCLTVLLYIRLEDSKCVFNLLRILLLNVRVAYGMIC